MVASEQAHDDARDPGQAAIAPWEARFRAHRTSWVRAAAERPERGIACSNRSGVYQIHRAGKDLTIDWFEAGHGHGAIETRVAWCRRSIEFVESKLGIHGPPLDMAESSPGG